MLLGRHGCRGVCGMVAGPSCGVFDLSARLRRAGAFPKAPIPRHLLETGPRNGAPSTASFATFLGFCGDVGIWFVVQAALRVVALDLSSVIPGPP